MIIAALISAGLAFSAAVYPSPSPLRLSDEGLTQLVHSESVDLIPPGSLNTPGPDLMSFDRPEIAKLVRLLDEAAAELPMENLVQLVTEYRLRDSVSSLQIVTSVAPVTRTGLVAAGGDVGPVLSAAKMPPQLLMLVELILRKASASGAAVLKIVADLISTLVYSIETKPDARGPLAEGVPSAPVPPSEPSPPSAPAVPGLTTEPSAPIAPAPPPSAPPDPAADAPAAPPAAEPPVVAPTPAEVPAPEIITGTTPEVPPVGPDLTPGPTEAPSPSVPEAEPPTQPDGSSGVPDSGQTGHQHDGGSSDSPSSEGSDLTSGAGQDSEADGGDADTAGGGSSDSGLSGEPSSGPESGPSGVD